MKAKHGENKHDSVVTDRQTDRRRFKKNLEWTYGRLTKLFLPGSRRDLILFEKGALLAAFTFGQKALRGAFGKRKKIEQGVT